MIDNLLSVKTLDFDYIRRKQANILIETLSYKGTILDVDSKNIIVLVDEDNDFKKNSIALIDFLYKECILKAECKVKKYDDGVLTLILPRAVKKIQKRENFRVECNIPCEIEKLLTGVIKNISVGGAFVKLDKVGRDVDFSNFRLSFAIDNREVSVKCTLIEKYERSLRIKFLDIPDSTFKLLDQYCTRIDKDKFKGRIYNDR